MISCFLLSPMCHYSQNWLIKANPRPTERSDLVALAGLSQTCMYACMHVCMYARTHARTHARIYVCVYVGMCIGARVFVSVFILCKYMKQFLK